MKIQTRRDALIHELRDLYSAETQLTKALPQLAKAASHEELSTALEEHLEETKEHVERLKRAFESLDVSPRGEKCAAMQGLIEEGKKVLEDNVADEMRDALIIASAQKVEHYEIASYGTVRTFAQLLGEDDLVDLLQETLDEESAADERLTEIAENIVNAEAEAMD
jgi:ferritin-like metal-binding protein YciE